MLTELREVITATVEEHCKLDTEITLEELSAEGGIYAELGEGFGESTSYNKQEIKVIPVLFLCRHQIRNVVWDNYVRFLDTCRD